MLSCVVLQNTYAFSSKYFLQTSSTHRLNYFGRVGRRPQFPDIYNQFPALLLRSQDPVNIGHGHGSSWNWVGCEQEKSKEEEGGKGLKSEPVQWLVHTRTHKHTQSHIHTYLVLLAYNQPRKGVFPLPEEIRVAPETNSGTKISFPFAQWICGAIPGRPQQRGLPKGGGRGGGGNLCVLGGNTICCTVVRTGPQRLRISPCWAVMDADLNTTSSGSKARHPPATVHTPPLLDETQQWDLSCSTSFFTYGCSFWPTRVCRSGTSSSLCTCGRQCRANHRPGPVHLRMRDEWRVTGALVSQEAHNSDSSCLNDKVTHSVFGAPSSYLQTNGRKRRTHWSISWLPHNAWKTHLWASNREWNMGFLIPAAKRYDSGHSFSCFTKLLPVFMALVLRGKD